MEIQITRSLSTYVLQNWGKNQMKLIKYCFVNAFSARNKQKKFFLHRIKNGKRIEFFVTCHFEHEIITELKLRKRKRYERARSDHSKNVQHTYQCNGSRKKKNTNSKQIKLRYSKTHSISIVYITMLKQLHGFYVCVHVNNVVQYRYLCMRARV